MKFRKYCYFNTIRLAAQQMIWKIPISVLMKAERYSAGINAGITLTPAEVLILPQDLALSFMGRTMKRLIRSAMM